MVSTYTVVLFFHLVGALVLGAGVTVAGVGFEVARRREEPGQIALLLGLTRIGVALVGAGGVLAGGCGLWLVHLGRWGFGTGWVSDAIALYVVALVIGGLAGQRPKRARLRAARLAGEGAAADPTLRALLNDPVSRAANYLSLLILVAIVALMAFKP
jgi:uncharacterized membrane protein